jgi:glutamate synthase domain-containing protein 2
MGISTIQSYHGAQVFEAIGLNQGFIDEYFTWTASRVGGIGLDEIARDIQERQARAFPTRPLPSDSLDPAASTSTAATASSTCSTRSASTSCSRPAAAATTRCSRSSRASSTTSRGRCARCAG